VVITDRFASSTAAYQAYAGGLGIELFDRINGAAVGDLQPDLTIVLDADPSVGFSRKFGGEESAGDRIERKSLEYHERVREGFLRYAEHLGERACVIDADQPQETVHQAILAALNLI
jgi:dTMP kinase